MFIVRQHLKAVLLSAFLTLAHPALWTSDPVPSTAAAVAVNPETVSVGVFITGLHNIDFSNNQFTGQFWAWFVGKNKDFKPSTTVEVVNAKNQRVMTSTRAETPKGMWDQVKFEALVHQRWDISNFPFDRQVLRFMLESTDQDSDHLRFVPDVEGSRLSPEVALDGWRLDSFRITTRDQSYPTSYGDPMAKREDQSVFSRVVVELELKREGWRLFIYTFLGFMLAIVLSTMVLAMNTTEYLSKTVPLAIRMTISTGALFASVGAAYTLQARLPVTTTYTLADAIQGTAFCGTMFAVLASLGGETLIVDGNRARALRFCRVLMAVFLTMMSIDALLVMRAVAS